MARQTSICCTDCGRRKTRKNTGVKRVGKKEYFRSRCIRCESDRYYKNKPKTKTKSKPERIAYGKVVGTKMHTKSLGCCSRFADVLSLANNVHHREMLKKEYAIW